MTVLIGNRPYAGYAAGSVATLDAPTEAALIQQGLATLSAALPTAGAIAPGPQKNGAAAFPAGVGSVIISHPECTEQSVVTATLQAAAADGTLTSIVRIVPANGQFTVIGNANATAITPFRWELINIPGTIRG